jgi:hypothetical protein
MRQMRSRVGSSGAALFLSAVIKRHSRLAQRLPTVRRLPAFQARIARGVALVPGEAVPQVLVYTLVQQDSHLAAAQQRFLRLFQCLQHHSADKKELISGTFGWTAKERHSQIPFEPLRGLNR